MKWFFLVLLAFCSVSAYGQCKMLKGGRYVSATEYHKAYLTDTLYSSCYYSLHVETNRFPDGQLELHADSLDIIRDVNLLSWFHAKVLGHPNRVTVYVFAHKKLIDSILFTVLRDIPDLSIRLEPERPLPCRRGMAYPVSRVIVDDNGYGAGTQIHFKVLSFVGCMKRNDKTLFEEHFCGDHFTDSFNEKLRDCIMRTDVFWLSSITVLDEENGNIYTKLNQLRLPNL